MDLPRVLRDRWDGMYPLRVSVTMSIHKLTAGAGYDYLTRQVAALDATRARVAPGLAVLLHRTGRDARSVDRFRPGRDRRPQPRVIR